jgi:hypothetical protein
MASAVRRLGSLSMARGCARIDAGPDTAKIGSADRVQVHHARLIAVIGVRKTYPHGLDPERTRDHRRLARQVCVRAALRLSRGWIIAAFITTAIFVGVLGRGVRF